MAKNSTITILVSTAIIIILVAALLTSIASESQLKTSKTSVVNEAIDISTARDPSGGKNITTGSARNFTVANYPSGWKVEDCPLTTVVYGNTSTTWTLDTDYRLDATRGIISVLNTTSTASSSVNATVVDYYYCASDYLNSSWGRSLLNLTPGLIAIALLVVAVYAAYQLLGGAGGKDED